jgi:hypothetical protein
MDEAKTFLVTGGRAFDDRDAVWRALDSLHSKYVNLTILHGACPTGADAHAQSWALDRERPAISVPAEWKKYGDSAGPRRNARLLHYLPHGVVAFAGGPGTKDMCRQAEAAGVKVWRP